MHKHNLATYLNAATCRMFVAKPFSVSRSISTTPETSKKVLRHPLVLVSFYVGPTHSTSDIILNWGWTGYTKLAERAGSVLQMNEHLDVSHPAQNLHPDSLQCRHLLQTTRTFDAFLEAQRAGDDTAVRLLEPLRLRYFSPTELLRLFAFIPPNASGQFHGEFVWPEDISTKTKYRLIGNSVNVRVVTELINYLFE